MTLLYVLAGIAAGVFVRSAALQVAAFQSIEDPILAGFVSATTLLGVASAAITFAVLRRHAAATAYVESAVSELDRVTWPTREETVDNTTVVVIAALGFGLLMFVYDFSWSHITTYALYTGVGK
ncbi:hypothetical protein LBMAG42_06280 [Deltaproteobacteria bacterium]|nr:hypothetical protein LBMAG42_06280 [Deltaproteobacteria bacterium]